MADRTNAHPRTATEVLGTVPTPRGFLRSLSRVVVIYRVASRAPNVREAMDYRATAETPAGTLASPDVLKKAAELRLRFVGVYEYFGLVGWLPREAWVTDDGVARLSARRDKAGPIEEAMSSYYFCTTFDDGTAIVTYSKPEPPIATSERSESQGGTGDLVADLDRHKKAVERRLLATPDIHPILVETVDDCRALSVHHDRFACSDQSLSSIFSIRLFGWGVPAAVVVVVLLTLLRLLHR